jgi:GMP synthase (glutamine-hydrolysing)
LTAATLGANVYRNRFSEIGWLPVELTDQGRRCALFEGFPARMQVFQWHNDTFDLPAGAVHIARSEGCGCQAFLYGVRVLGLQFHFELTQRGLTEFLKNVPDELPEGPYIQNPRDLIAPEKNFRLANSWMNEIMNRMEWRVKPGRETDTALLCDREAERIPDRSDEQV